MTCSKFDRITGLDQPDKPPLSDRYRSSFVSRFDNIYYILVSGKMDPRHLIGIYMYTYMALLYLFPKNNNLLFFLSLFFFTVRANMRRYTFIARITANANKRHSRISKGANQRNSVLWDLLVRSSSSSSFFFPRSIYRMNPGYVHVAVPQTEINVFHNL